MEIQNCPLCGSKANYDIPFAYCTNSNCDLSDLHTLETWNKIRIAPDGEDVEIFKIGDIEIHTLGWMNPNYPKEKR